MCIRQALQPATAPTVARGLADAVVPAQYHNITIHRIKYVTYKLITV